MIDTAHLPRLWEASRTLTYSVFGAGTPDAAHPRATRTAALGDPLQLSEVWRSPRARDSTSERELELWPVFVP